MKLILFMENDNYVQLIYNPKYAFRTIRALTFLAEEGINFEAISSDSVIEPEALIRINGNIPKSFPFYLTERDEPLTKLLVDLRKIKKFQLEKKAKSI